MGNTKKKETIHFLYDSIFNKKQYEKLSEIISPDCTNQFGTKGVAGFQETIFELTKAFPDAQWEVKEIIADGNKVVVKQKFIGTHKNQFQSIQPTNKIVSVDGIVTYEFKNGKIIGSQVQTDRLGFLQQLGVLPNDVSNLPDKKQNPDAILEQRINVLTIGADDLNAMKSFYGQVLGWTTVAENKDIAFYKLNGFLLSICNKKMLADFIGIDYNGQGFRSVTIGYNVDNKEEVLKLYDQLKDKVKILKEPTEPPFGGLFFYFTDIEGNIIEIAQNSFITLDKHKNAINHKPIDHL